METSEKGDDSCHCRGLACSGIAVYDENIGLVAQKERGNLPYHVFLARSRFVFQPGNYASCYEIRTSHLFVAPENHGEDYENRIDFHTAEYHVNGKYEFSYERLCIVVAHGAEGIQPRAGIAEGRQRA